MRFTGQYLINYIKENQLEERLVFPVLKINGKYITDEFDSIGCDNNELLMYVNIPEKMIK